jgi:choline-sulfatase
MAFFEAAARVPLIVRTPGGPAGARVAEPVSQLDLAPTLLDLCGLDGAGAMDGRSLAAALAGEPLGAADVVAEYLAEGVNSPAVMLRRGRHKYICCEDDPEQLYDVGADPHELVDLAQTETGLCAELRAAVQRRWDMPALRAQVLRSQEERRLVVAALRRGRPASWNFVPRADAEFIQGKDDLYEFQRRARLDVPGR